MIDNKVICEVKKRLINVYDPLLIYLFGSYVWGSPEKSSDLDLLVVVKNSTEKPYKRSIIGSKSLIDLEIPNDIIVYTFQEFEKKSKDITTLCYKIKTEGKMIYEKL